MTDIVFLDTETLGTDPDAPIWEFAALRRFEDGTVDRAEITIRHDPGDWLETLPERFQQDYLARYNHDDATTESAAAAVIDVFTRDTVAICCNPLFDLDSKRLTNLLQRNGIEPGWHYHPLDISSIAIGYLAAWNALGGQPWKYDKLSASLGVDPAEYRRHTAMGDVEWTVAQWDIVMGRRVGGVDATRNR